MAAERLSEVSGRANAIDGPGVDSPAGGGEERLNDKRAAGSPKANKLLKPAMGYYNEVPKGSDEDAVTNDQPGMGGGEELGPQAKQRNMGGGAKVGSF